GDRRGSVRPSGDVRPVVWGVGARDLLPQGVARLLPHARVQPRGHRLHFRPRRRSGRRPLVETGAARGCRAGPASRDLAALSPVPGEREDPDRAVHAAGAMTRRLHWLAIAALVVLAARTLAYALAPQPTVVGNELERQVGGPSLVVTALVALVGAAAVASA